MKLNWGILAVMGFAATSVMAAPDVAPAMDKPITSLSTDQDKLSYSIGVDLGRNIKRQDMQISVPAMAKGIQDVLNKQPLLMTDEKIKDTLVEFQKLMMAKRATLFQQKAKDNAAAGEAFFKANATKPGVVTLPSGLQYKILTPGKGPKPTKDDTVTVEYTGKLLDGQIFDSTSKTGKPATFKVTQVIPGWTEALQLMPAGSIWEIYVPSSLAYGSRNSGGPIGPNETLIFNIHLISTKK